VSDVLTECTRFVAHVKQIINENVYLRVLFGFNLYDDMFAIFFNIYCLCVVCLIEGYVVVWIWFEVDISKYILNVIIC